MRDSLEEAGRGNDMVAIFAGVMNNWPAGYNVMPTGATAGRIGDDI